MRTRSKRNMLPTNSGNEFSVLPKRGRIENVSTNDPILADVDGVSAANPVINMDNEISGTFREAPGGMPSYLAQGFIPEVSTSVNQGF